MLTFIVQHANRANAVRRDPFHHIGDRLQRDAQIYIRGQTLEHSPLASGQQLGSLTLGDIGDAAANQALTVRLQSYPTHLARNVIAQAVPEHPFEHRRLARQGAIELRAIGVR